MYNRYVPQSDGSYRRSRVPDPPPKQAERCPVPLPKDTGCCVPVNKPEERPCPPPPPPAKPHPHQPSQPPKASAPGFLQQLLPRDFDTGDLIVVLLLLLLAGDCEEDRGTALLTLALYLFM